MQHNASQRSSGSSKKVKSHGGKFAKVLDGRKQPVRGLTQRGGRYYARLSIEDYASGKKSVRRVPLTTKEGNRVETAAQAIAELNRLRTQRSDATLPQLGRTPTFTDYADTYLATIKLGDKKPATIEKEEAAIGVWKNHIGGIRLDKIRPAHITTLKRKLLADGNRPRTVELYVIALRNVLKCARDDDEYITALPIPAGISKELKSKPPKRELFSPEELDRLCAAAMAKDDAGSPVTKNGQQFCDYMRLMAYSGTRRNEALALRWADVDFNTGKLAVERQAGNGGDIPTKNSESRQVDFNPSLKKHLQEMKSRRAPDSQWLFPSPQRGEKDIHAMSFRESLELARAHARMAKVGFHDMRHLFCSFCVMSGVDFMTIAKWVGHKDGGILIGKVYGHLAESHTKKAAQSVNFGPVMLDNAIAQ